MPPDSSKDTQQGTESRVEYMLVGEERHSGKLQMLSGVRRRPETAGHWPAFTNVRWQQRTVSIGPWEEVEGDE